MKHLLLVFAILLILIAAVLIVLEPSNWTKNIHLFLIGGIALEYSITNNKSKQKLHD